MDRLLSLFSVYDFLGYALAGGILLAGSYWAFAGLPDEPGAGAIFGLIVLAYAVGHAVQSLGTVWEGWVWNLQGKPSELRMESSAMQGPGRSTSRAYGSVLQQQIKEKIARASGEQDLGVAEMFSFARAELRANHVDERAELMNTMYGLCRGLTTATGLLIPIFVGAGIKTDDWGRLVIGIAIAAAFSILYFRRTARYSFRFADQVWLDFAALHLPDWR